MSVAASTALATPTTQMPSLHTPLVEVAAEEAVDVLARTAHPCLQVQEIREDVDRVLSAVLPHLVQGIYQELEARAYLSSTSGDIRTATAYRNANELIAELLA